MQMVQMINLGQQRCWRGDGRPCLQHCLDFYRQPPLADGSWLVVQRGGAVGNSLSPVTIGETELRSRKQGLGRSMPSVIHARNRAPSRE